MRRYQFLTSLVAIAAVAFAVQASEVPGGRPLTADLTGAAESPGPGDPDGSGWARIWLNQGQGFVSFEIQVFDVAPPTAAHIHVGAAGIPGGVVVPLSAPWTEIEDGVFLSFGGVENVDPDLIKAIRQNPADYYVNVHNAEFPPGAVRGQLSK